MLAVLDFDPVLRPTCLIRTVTPFRHQTLKAHVAGGAEQVRPDLATLERIHDCSFRSVWSPSRAGTCISCRGAAPAGTLRPRTGPEPRRRPLPAPSIRCRKSGPLLLEALV